MRRQTARGCQAGAGCDTAGSWRARSLMNPAFFSHVAWCNYGGIRATSRGMTGDGPCCNRNSCLLGLPASTCPGLDWGNDSDPTAGHGPMHRVPDSGHSLRILLRVSPRSWSSFCFPTHTARINPYYQRSPVEGLVSKNLELMDGANHIPTISHAVQSETPCNPAIGCSLHATATA